MRQVVLREPVLCSEFAQAPAEGDACGIPVLVDRSANAVLNARPELPLIDQHRWWQLRSEIKVAGEGRVLIRVVQRQNRRGTLRCRSRLAHALGHLQSDRRQVGKDLVKGLIDDPPLVRQGHQTNGWACFYLTLAYSLEAHRGAER